MSDLAHILDRLDRLEKQLERLETQRNLKPQEALQPSLATHQFSPEPQHDSITGQNPVQNQPAASEPEGRNLLGIIAVVCFALAALLLIKFSINSGWLTPVRQILLATMTGVLFSLSGFVQWPTDRKYMSQLPATGIIILNLVVYGSVFYHQIIQPSVGIFSLSLVALWSLVLAQYLRRDLFAVMSIVGVYVGAFVFSESFNALPIQGQFSAWGLFLIFWNSVFAFSSVSTKNRKLIVIAGYISMGLFGLKASSIIALAETAGNLSIIKSAIFFQSAQFLIFSVATVVYSIVHRTKLESADAWLLLPLVLFYYGQVFYFLEMLNLNYAVFFAITLSMSLFGFYKIAEKKLAGRLASRNMVYSAISFLLLHSFYFVKFTDEVRVRVVLVIGFAFLFSQLNKNADDNPLGSKISVAIMGLYSSLLVFWGYSTPDVNLISSFAYGLVGLLMYAKLSSTQLTGRNLSTLATLVLSFSNLQVTVGIWRLKEYVPLAAISPLWMIYAIALLIWSAQSRKFVLARQALVLICIAFLRFMVFQYFELPMGLKIVTLFLLGLLIFICGYLYRYALRRTAQS